MLMQIHENEKLIEKIWVYMIKNGCGYCSHVVLKLAVSQGWIGGSYAYLCMLLQNHESYS